jgi:hypothetical protein
VLPLGGDGTQDDAGHDAQGRARALKRETYALYLAVRDPRAPWYAKAVAVVAYLGTPDKGEEANGELGPGESVEHACHTADPTCPGGLACPHLLCHNLKHLEGVSSEENSRRRWEWARRRERARGRERPGRRG